MSNAVLAFAYQTKMDHKQGEQHDPIIAMVTGDRDFKDTVDRVLYLLPRVSVEIWSWDKGLAKIYRQMAAEASSRVSTRLLDGCVGELEYVNALWMRSDVEMPIDRTFVIRNYDQNAETIISWKHELGRTFKHLVRESDLVVISELELEDDGLAKLIQNFNDLHADSGKGVQAVPLAITRDEERSRDRSRSESRPPSRASSVASSYRSDHRPATPTTNYFAGLESNVAGPTTRPFRTVTNIKTEAKQRGEVQVGWTIWAC